MKEAKTAFLALTLALAFPISLLTSLSAHAAEAVNIAEERAKLRDQLRTIRNIYKVIADKSPNSSHAAAITANVDGAYVVPPGFQEMHEINAQKLSVVLSNLDDNKPITMEAIHDYRKKLIEGDVITASLLHNLAWNTAVVHKSGTNPDILKVFRYQYDDKGVIRAAPTQTLSLGEADLVIRELIQVRVPDFKVPFRLGTVTLEGAAAKAEADALQQAARAARDEMESLERAVTRQQADFDKQLNLYLEKAKPVTARMEAAIKAANGNRDEIAKARHYAEIELNSLAGPHENIRPGLEKDKEQLLKAQGAYAKAAAAARLKTYQGLPAILSIKSQHAELRGTKNQADEIAQVEELITRYMENQANLTKTRKEVLEQLKDAVSDASKAADKLGSAVTRSYVAQALTQAFVQLMDNATAAKGDPSAFIVLSSIQMIANVTFAKPAFYDYELNKDGKPKPAAVTERKNVNSMLEWSSTTSFFKTLGGKGINELTKRHQPWNPRLFGSVEEATAQSTLRRVTGRTLSQNLARIGKQRNSSLLGSITEGLAIDAVTELTKSKIAEELTKNEVRDYADAQLLVGALATALHNIYRLEDHDEKMLKDLRDRRRELSEEIARPLEGRQKIRPALSYKKNEKFEIHPGYTITVELDGRPAPPADLYIEGVRATPLGEDEPGKFKVNQAVLAQLAKGAKERLELTIKLK